MADASICARCGSDQPFEMAEANLSNVKTGWFLPPIKFIRCSACGAVVTVYVGDWLPKKKAAKTDQPQP